MDARDLAVAVARGRSAIGVAALIAPSRVVGAMVEDQGDSGPLLGRMLGARDLALGLGVVIAIDRGAPVRGWLEASALADGGDFVAALLSRHRIRPAFFPALLAIAGGAALINLWLARQLDPPPPASPGQPEAALTGHSA